MPGEDPPTPGGPRSPKKRTPIDLSVSPSKTKRGSPPKKKLRQQSILLSMRTKTRHDELAQAAEELGLPALAPFKSAKEADGTPTGLHARSRRTGGSLAGRLAEAIE